MLATQTEDEAPNGSTEEMRRISTEVANPENRLTADGFEARTQN